MLRTAVSSAALLAVLAGTGPVSAGYREPTNIARLFPAGLVKRIALPGPVSGFMFKTIREPVLVAAKERSQFVIITNGVDDRRWSYVAILGTLLRNYCGIRDAGFAKTLVGKTYAAKNVGADQDPEKRLLRESAVSSGCKVSIEIKGPRWHKITTTFEASSQ
ncbi:MAG: hypothetical protein MI824_00875 [Hyphomicrobiales bacterium]|nr:hypothetical protein [Hyphomicrobiales bacterium]